MKKKIGKFIQWSALLSLAAIALTGFGYTLGHPAVVAATTPEVIDLTPAKIEALKAQVVAKIAQCESAGHSEEEGIIIFDSNNVPSIGQLQFQRKTVIYYMKKLYGTEINANQATIIALDTKKASELAQDVIFKADGLANWLNCSNKLGLRAQVDAISFLEK